MIREFVEKWDKYKKDLEDYFRNTKQSEYDKYEKIVKLLFEKVIDRDKLFGEYDLENMIVIDDGQYSGTQIFIIHKDSYQPDIDDYVYTHTYYGSCSGCDTLLRISCYDEDFPDESQVEAYMTIALHLLQRLKIMGKD